MKRKADFMDEDCGTPFWTSRSPLSESSTCSHDSLDRTSLRPVPWSLHPPRASMTIAGANSRTRKRYRDNRPEMETIHQNTLAKLYNAQNGEQPTSACTSRVANNATQLWKNNQYEPAQRSLHSFFNIRQPEPATVRSIQFQFQFIDSQPASCAGCGDTLGNSKVSQPIHQDAMEMDQALLCPEEYECAACQRSVCDTCAVRGNQRICLECALPGT